MDTDFTYEELLDERDRYKMFFVGINTQNDTNTPCGVCIYGGMCGCFAPNLNKDCGHKYYIGFSDSKDRRWNRQKED